MFVSITKYTLPVLQILQNSNATLCTYMPNESRAIRKFKINSIAIFRFSDSNVAREFRMKPIPQNNRHTAFSVSNFRKESRL